MINQSSCHHAQIHRHKFRLVQTWKFMHHLVQSCPRIHIEHAVIFLRNDTWDEFYAFNLDLKFSRILVIHIWPQAWFFFAFFKMLFLDCQGLQMILNIQYALFEQIICALFVLWSTNQTTKISFDTFLVNICQLTIFSEMKRWLTTYKLQSLSFFWDMTFSFRFFKNSILFTTLYYE